MQLTAPKLIAGFITALWGFVSLLGAPNALSEQPNPNGGSRGLLQINGSWNKWLIGKGIIAKPKDLLQAQTNLLAGLEIYNYGVERYGFGWGPWGTK